MVMCITADGHKLPPYILLSRKMIHKHKMLPKDVTMHAQNIGLMTTDLMEDWVRKIWERRPGAVHNPPSML
jgi:hypothetical protein